MAEAGGQGTDGHEDLFVWLKSTLESERALVGQLLLKRHEDLLHEVNARISPDTVPQKPAFRSSISGLSSSTGVGPPPPRSKVNAAKRRPLTSSQMEPAVSSMEVEGAMKSEEPVDSRDVGVTVPTKIGRLPTDESRSPVYNQVEQIVQTLKSMKPPATTEPWYKKKVFWLEIAPAIVIALNILTMTIETEYERHDKEKFLGLGDKTSEEAWPGGGVAFETMEWIFGMCFVIEFIVRTYIERCQRDILWNLLDFGCISCWFFDRVLLGFDLGFNTTLLRMLRLVRLLRLLKLIRHARMLDPLFLMFQSIKSSMSVLSWTLVLLAAMMMICAMVNSFWLSSFMTENDGQANRDVYLSWGTFLRAYVSMFEITFANWGPPCWLLMNEVNEWWGMFFILWRCCFGFAVIQVITAVFIQHTFKVAGQDEDTMIKEKERSTQQFMQHLEHLFEALDESGDGLISKEEFDRAVSEPRVKHWCAALELEMSNVERVFAVLDDGDGMIDRDEFITGIKGLKGSAKSIDMFQVLCDLNRIKAYLISDPEAQRPSMLAAFPVLPNDRESTFRSSTGGGSRAERAASEVSSEGHEI